MDERGEQRRGATLARNLSPACGVLGRTEGSSRDVVPIRGEFTTPETTVVPQQKQRDTRGEGAWGCALRGLLLMGGRGSCLGAW